MAGRFRSARTQRHTRTLHGCELPPRPRTFTRTHRDTRARGACCPEHPMLPSPGPLSAPGFSPPLPRAALDTRARQTAQAAAAGTLHTKPANERSTVCGGSGTRPSLRTRRVPSLECTRARVPGASVRERGPAIPGAMVTARGRPPRTVADTQNAASCEQERGRTPLGHVPSPFEGTAFELRPHSTASLSANQSCSRPSSQVHPVPRHDTEAKGSDRSHGSQPAGLAGPTLPSRPPAHAVPMAGDPAVQGHVCPLPSEAGRPPAGRGHLVCCSTGHDRSRRPL